MRYGDRPALTSHEGLRSQTWSYSRLWAAAQALARHFRQHHHLAPGTPVVLWATNSPELVAAMFGAMTAGLVVVPFDPSATPEFVRRVAAITRAGLVVSTAGAAADLGVAAIGLAGLPFDTEGDPLLDQPSPDDVAEVVFTSGTTGTPKGVVLSHRNITSNVGAALRLVPDRPFRLISLLPLSHMFEQTVGLYGPLKIGSTIHYPSSLRAPVIVKAIRRNRVSAMVVVPRVLELMMDQIERAVARGGNVRRWEAAHRLARRLPLGARRWLFRPVHRSLGGHLRHVICGGAHLPVELAAAWERIGIRVVEGYGTTECSPIVSANTYWERRLGSVGRPLAGVEVHMSSDGEILVRGPNVFNRYWDAPDATARALDEHGWYHTGDLASLDDEGYLTIIGRRSDRIVLPSGLNVYPEDIENELREEPEVDDCVVLSMPDAAGRPRIWAVVIPGSTDGGPPAESSAIEAAMRRASQRLAPHQRPAGWSLWPGGEFPRTNLGKVKRFEVEHAVVAAVSAPAPSRAEPVYPPGPFDRLRRLLAEVGRLDVDRVHPASDLTLDLGLDSLGLLELAVALEDELGIVIEDGDLAEVGSVGDLWDLIKRETAATPEKPAPDWPRAWWARWLRSVLQRALLSPAHRLVARPFRVKGQGVFDGVTGPVLMVANHCSHADTPSILRALPARIRRRTMVAAAADYFYRSELLGAWLSLSLGTFPFTREGSVRPSLERCGALADDGWSILIYPEGTRSVTGTLAPFQRGIGYLAMQLAVPVIPIGIVGTYRVWPKGRRLPTRGAVTVRFGPPIEVGPDDTGVVERLESAVAALSCHPAPV